MAAGKSQGVTSPLFCMAPALFPFPPLVSTLHNIASSSLLFFSAPGGRPPGLVPSISDSV